jgi:hypothetical protein
MAAAALNAERSMQTTRLPGFVIIGAAKSGTTTLYADLGAHENIFFPVVKEPADLARDGVLTRRGVAAYRRLFDAARDDQISGEASTAYTNRPMQDGAAERAYRVIGPALKLIYIVRDPFERVLSEHRYAAKQGKISGDLVQALRETPRLVERSRYAYQLEPWLERFPRENVRIVAFEQYIANRDASVRALFSFLGLATPEHYKLPVAQNSTDDVIVARGVLKNLVRTQLYRRTVRRLMPLALRERAKRSLGHKLDVKIDQHLTREHEQYLLDRLRPDVTRFHEIAGWTQPMWPRFA